MDSDDNTLLVDLDNHELFKAKVSSRFLSVWRNFDEVNERMRIRGFDVFHISPALLYHAVESYFLDIKRLKSFHPIKKADRFKMGGFSIKWMSKVRPIQVKYFPIEDEKAALMAVTMNARFAVMQGLSMSGICIPELNRALVKETSAAGSFGSGQILDSLVYNATYRDFDGHAWSQLLLALYQKFPEPKAPAGKSQTTT
jgi:hypothetical protein